MSNNPASVRHYKLLIDSVKFQLANIPPDGATAVVMEAWGREFVQTWVSRPGFVPILLTLSLPSIERARERPSLRGVVGDDSVAHHGFSSTGRPFVDPLAVVGRIVPAEHRRAKTTRAASGKEAGGR